jgi:hypothetical protein
VKLIARVKLQPSPEQAGNRLRQCAYLVFNAACDWLAERALQVNVFTAFKLQAACYKGIRLLFGLSAQATFSSGKRRR